ncbi:tetratricopeptide repeat protein 5-like [Cimex lectularius]|uniref:Tetratricopeptide repeat protein 5 OB fold domain-containing protein n=1 Tax=Cimex lectularius TaxID=79782 RepID=A0A8I6RZY0_CIMLE|nr:tetratricopeptide repeat protein 5-like [Cimex lectularius]
MMDAFEEEPYNAEMSQTSAINLVKLQYEYLCKYKEDLVNKKHSPEMVNTLMTGRILNAERFFLAYKERCFVESKVEYWLLVGQIFNLSPNFVTKSIDALSKAVKLDPKRISTWNLLGEAYCNNSEQVLAEKCFENALEQKRNVVSLRNLSILSRKRSEGDCKKRKESAEKGIALAKEAVSLNLKDGTSWGVLGNAYISAYFSIKPDPSYAYKAISAYKQAEKTQEGKGNCDLYHNKYVALKFVEEYCEALEAVSKALELAPTWQLAVDGRNSLMKYLDDINHFSATHGKLKPKKVTVLRKSICRIDLGPYANNRSYKPCNIGALQPGPNPKCVIYGKVTWNLQVDDTFPFTFGFLDSNGDSLVVTLYNLAERKGFIIGDAVAIPDPHLTVVDFTFDDKVYQFLKVKVNSPASVILNGKPTPSSYNGAIGYVSFETVN